MKGTIDPPGPAGGAPGGTLRRLGWFVLLWAAGVAVTGAVGFLIRSALRHSRLSLLALAPITRGRPRVPVDS